MNGFSLIFHPGRRFQSLTDWRAYSRVQWLNNWTVVLSKLNPIYLSWTSGTCATHTVTVTVEGSLVNDGGNKSYRTCWWNESVAALTVFISFLAGVVCKYLHLGISSSGSVPFCGSFDWSTVLSKKSEVLRLWRSFRSEQLQWAELSTIRLSHLCTGISRIEYLCEWGMIQKMFE